MNSRLSRPLLAVAVSGALVGGLAAGPAFAGPDTTPSGITSAVGDPTPEPTKPPASPTTSPDPTPTAEPTPPGDPTGTGDPTATADPTATTEPTATGEPTTTGEPTATAEPTATDDPPVEPAPDTLPPAGKFTLNSAALWIGQSVSLTQGAVTDDTSTPDQISRVVTWGDGTSSTLAAGTAKYSHKYTRTGKFTVTVTYLDAAGNSGKATSAVTVATPGKVKLSKTSVWNGERFFVAFSSVPAGTTKIALNWGDGYVSTHAGKNQSIRGLYYTRKNGGLVTGGVTLYATYTNKLGASSAIRIGTVTVKKDKSKPVVKIKKPSSPNRLKSWKTIKGTVSDKGATSPYVYVWVERVTGSKTYCYTTKKTWKRYYGNAGYDKYCGSSPVEVKISGGKWSMKLPGLKKGTIYVSARAWDWSDNASKWASAKAKMTRS
jgi:hypothetical protein